MAVGLPARSEIPESEKVKVKQQIKTSRALIEMLNQLPKAKPHLAATLLNIIKPTETDIK